MDVNEEFQKIKEIHAPAILLKDGGNPIVLLPQFSFRVADSKRKTDLLLYPYPHSGYPTRLFFLEKIEGKGQNWKEHTIIDRKWWAPSWNYVQPTLPWPEILRAHLRSVL